MRKTNNKGVFHPSLIIIFAITLVAIAGTYLLVSSQAAQIDGPVASYSAYEKKINRAPAGSRTKIVNLARQQLGYTEAPTNKVKFFDWAGDRPGRPGPWCSVFATWVWHGAGVKDESGSLYPKRPLVRDVWNDGARHGRAKKSRPKPGDAIIYGNFRHIGIVEKVSGKKLAVIEGNSGLGDQPDKYVIRRIIWLNSSNNVPYGYVRGFVSPP